MYKLIHQRTQRILAEKVEIANTVWSRGVGLLGRKTLSVEQVLWIEGCSSVHTCFMAFPIDVIYLNQNQKIVKVVRHLKPWRCSMAWGASIALEWMAGALPEDLQLGDELVLLKKG